MVEALVRQALAFRVLRLYEVLLVVRRGRGRVPRIKCSALGRKASGGAEMPSNRGGDADAAKKRTRQTQQMGQTWRLTCVVFFCVVVFLG